LSPFFLDVPPGHPFVSLIISAFLCLFSFFFVSSNALLSFIKEEQITFLYFFLPLFLSASSIIFFSLPFFLPLPL
jgi:hypothetical protein